MEQYYEKLRAQLRPRFTEFLKADSIPFYPPALTVCPHCHENCGIIADTYWSCQRCGKRGDIVDYAVANNAFKSEADAIKHLCRVLRVKNTKLDLFSADEIMDMQFSDTVYVVEKLFTKGLHILAGPSKAGKSWLALWMAHRISTGQPIWGFPTHQGTVLYMCLEDPLDRVQRRLVDVTGGETGNILIATEAELMGNGFEDQLITTLTEHPEINFVLIDTLQKIRDMKSERYSYSGDYNTMTGLKNLADRFGVCILLIHHTRKAPSNDPFDMVSGTTGLMGCADSTFVMLKESRLSNQATLDATGRDIEDMHFDLLFNAERMCWDLVGSSLDEERVPKNHAELQLIRNFVSEVGSWQGTATELIEILSRLGRISAAPNSLTRILNANQRLLRGYYHVNCRTGQKIGNAKIISLSVLPSDKYDKTDTPPAPEGIVQTVHTAQ